MRDSLFLRFRAAAECRANKNRYSSVMQKITGRFGELYMFDIDCFHTCASPTFAVEHFVFWTTLIGDVDFSVCAVDSETLANKLRIGHVFATTQKRKSKRNITDTFL